MKRIYATFLALAICLSLAACGNNSEKPIINDEVSTTENTTAPENTTEDTEEPEETKETEAAKPEATGAAANETVNQQADTIRPEFKEAMDTYEAFYDEYCKFMAEYKKNPSDFSLLGKYTEMLTKLTEMNEAFEAWDEGEMSNAELKYYLEVNSRVTQKMVGIAG